MNTRWNPVLGEALQYDTSKLTSVRPPLQLLRYVRYRSRVLWLRGPNAGTESRYAWYLCSVQNLHWLVKSRRCSTDLCVRILLAQAWTWAETFENRVLYDASTTCGVVPAFSTATTDSKKIGSLMDTISRFITGYTHITRCIFKIVPLKAREPMNSKPLSMYLHTKAFGESYEGRHK